MRAVVRGKASGVPLDLRWGVVFHLHDHKIDRVDIHGSWTKALQAAGLVE